MNVRIGKKGEAELESIDDSKAPGVDSKEADTATFVRYGTDELTGLPVVNARPGTRFVTSEEIRELLEDFP